MKPRRTIRIGLWSGEEQGLLGAQAYVTQHLGSRPEPTDPDLKDLAPYRWGAAAGPFRARPEHARLSAYFNLDNGGGRIRGIYADAADEECGIFYRPVPDKFSQRL